MKNRLLPTICWLFALCLVPLTLPALATVDFERIAEAHWHPQTAAESRRMTVAAALWLTDEASDVDDWEASIHARLLELSRRGERVPGQWAPLADGLFAWLVQAREHNLATAGEPFPEPELKFSSSPAMEPAGSGRIGRMERVAALVAPDIWSRLHQRLVESDPSFETDELASLWGEVFSRMEEDADSSTADYARSQAQRTMQLVEALDLAERIGRINRILLAQVAHEWGQERVLEAVWLAFEALARLSVLDDPRAEAAHWSEWLESLDAEQVRLLRRVDTDMPVIIALLEDAAGYLSAPDPAAQRAVAELADVYARMALFVSDMSFYLDQPVRSRIRRTVAACNPDPLLVGPMPREVYERCVRNLFELLDTGLDTEELAGGRQGPFAAEFLRRELGLVSWQRAAYLDGHLGWMLDVPCEPPMWVNVLEWSLMVEHLARWVPRRSVFFAGPRWQEALADVREDALGRAEMHQEWMDCISGHGSERLDPVLRLLDRHDNALRELRALMTEAHEQFYSEAVRPGADIDLDGAARQPTGYRPERLMVRPCPEADACGARVELPVSRALLGLFPNAFLLADQLGMGELQMCYESVRWVDRATRPARQRDGKVANYEGRLSFELVGLFAREHSEEPETVFRHRLTASEPRHYLFAAADPELLDLECPREVIGTSILSSLPDERMRLIPDRLTYFASAPTTPEAQLLANWDRGAEWRDWFLTGDRVEELEATDGAELEVAVQAHLTALAARRERQLAAPLTTPVRAGESSPMALAMVRVADSTAMLRRLFEIHYPRLIRHDESIRSMLAGEAGLINRDRVRMLRDEGMPMQHVPRVGLERSELLRERWMQLPVGLREQGQRAPEVDYGFERLENLLRLSRYEPALFELPAEP
jgi:hypothetical protein